MPSPDPPTPPRAAEEPVTPGGEEALCVELIAAVDHDLRTSLTTVLGALQTLARPGQAPADPDLAQLLSAALAQAQRMHRLLDELPAAATRGEGRPLPAAELAHLIREAAGGDGRKAEVEMPPGLPPVCLSAPGLRRALAGTLARARGGPAVRVAVAADGPDCRITITHQGEEPPAVPGQAARLVAAMGGWIERTADAGAPGVCLVFPRACLPRR